MAGVENHQNSGAAIRKVMFNVAREPRFFKRISGKNRKFRLKCRFFPYRKGASAFSPDVFHETLRKNGVFRLILALFAVILLE